jgi:dTDP-4-amino-4,6-dideoxygalactose transaminase
MVAGVDAGGPVRFIGRTGGFLRLTSENGGAEGCDRVAAGNEVQAEVIEFRQEFQMAGKIRGLMDRFNASDANAFPGVIGTFMGRDALALLVSTLDIQRPDKVLLPAYLCREVLKPFRGHANIEFYDLNPDLSIDPDEIRQRVVKDRLKLLYIINYFGFLQPHRKEIKAICADYGVILAEDCAHSLLTEGSGETGDVLLYSFRKILPLPDGGGLKLNIEKPVVGNFYPKTYSNCLSILSLAKLMLKFRSEIFSRSGISSRTTNLLQTPGQRVETRRILPMSSLARAAMNKLDFKEIIEKRRSDFRFWLELAEETTLFEPVFTSLPSGVCPLGFPVKVTDRKALEARLRQEGIPLRVHWPLPAEGRAFANSYELSLRICTLPVFPDLGQHERKVFRDVFLHRQAAEMQPGR